MKQIPQHLKAARDVFAKADAENRDLTADERAQVEQHLKAHESWLAGTKPSTPGWPTGLKGFEQLLGLEPGPGTDRKSSTWSTKTADALMAAMPAGPGGTKALVSGTITTANVIEANPVPMARTARTVLDLIPTPPPRGPQWNPDPSTLGTAPGSLGDGATQDGSNTFQYLRQTVRTNNANVTPDLALKPTSVYTLDEVNDWFRIIAHLSEPVPLRYFADHPRLRDFLRMEMEYGLREKLEQQVISGTGAETIPGDPSSAQLVGVLNTSGVQAVPFATDLLTTARKAITAMDNYGVTPNAWVMAPADAEAFDLLREGAGTGQYLLGGPGAASDLQLWSIPRVTSTSLTAGTAILADWTTTELVVRQDATLAIDLGGDNFTHNTATMRVEGRFGFAAKQPWAVAVVDLTA
ncbi:phage major capsid protein [Intrasporangium sp. DVR]|uniref:phage major capsid protein n=1 Tax=Intrasporangium sp. DVR TaxID=3127867 RepID=UPI00313A5923